MSFFPIFSPVSSSAVTAEFGGSGVNATEDSSYTFSSIGLGTAASDRFLVVGFGTGENRTVATVTVAGNSAAQILSYQNSGTIEFWGLSLATGTSGDVVVGLSGGNGKLPGCGVWAIYGANTTETDTDTVAAADPMVGSLTIPANGVGIGYFYTTHGNSSTWTNLDEDFDEKTKPSDNHLQGGAHKTYSTLQSGLSITADLAVSTTQGGMILAAYGPA